MIDKVRLRRRAFLGMSWSERRSAVGALLALTWVRVALSTLGFRRAQALVARRVADPLDPGARALGADRGAVAQTTARAVDRAARAGPRPPACLPRALTLWWLLRRQGLAAEIRIGTRRVASDLEAHAWVEFEGQILNDSPDVHEHFAAFSGPIHAFTGPVQSRAGIGVAGSSRPLGGSSG